MRYESYLSTHAYYKYDVSHLVVNGKLDAKNALVKELKKYLQEFDLDVALVPTLTGPKLVIYMYTAFNDELNESGIGVVGVDVENFTDEDVEAMQDLLDDFFDYVKENASDELKVEIEKMNLVEVAHHIYFNNEELD